MKPIIVQDQVRLGAARCLALSLQGMSYRLFRSAVTVAILALAVAFLVHMVAYGLIAQRTKLLAYRELQDSRLLGEWITRLTTPDAAAVILANLVQGARLEEYRSWSGATPAEFDRARQLARQLDSVVQYFDTLPAATRLVLTGGAPLTFVADLAGETQYKLFLKRLAELRLPPPLGNLETFERLLRRDAPELLAFVRQIQAGHQRAIERLQVRYAGRTPRELLADPPQDFPPADFQLSAATLSRLAALAQADADVQRLNQLINAAAVKPALARQMNERAAQIDLARVLDWLDEPAHARRLAAELAKDPDGENLKADRLLNLARHARRQAQLQRVVGDEIPAARGGWQALPVQARWLIVVSFLVCAVGVANAMLMSVTERFAEIATMKCLGALNGFVMKVFFFEAVLHGMCGGLIGIFIGLLLAGLRSLAEFGPLAFAALPVANLVTGLLGAWLMGLVLAAAAAIGPVWVAARLAPMEAMRVE